MSSSSVEFLKSAVVILGLCTLGAAVGIYLLMEIHYRRQQARQARKVILENRLSRAPAEKDPRVSWSTSSRADREIIMDILAEQATLADPKWQDAIQQVFFSLGVFDEWLGDLRRGSVARRVHAAMRLGSVRDPRAVEALVSAAEDRAWQVRLAITISLGRWADPRGVPGLIRVARHPSRSVPDLTLAAALAACAEEQPALLAGLLRAPESRLRIIASWALSEIADPSVLQPLLDITEDPDPEVRAKSARALARLHERESVEALSRLARDPVWFVRVRAQDALAELGDVRGEDAVLSGIEDPVREVRYRAASALRRIRGMRGEVAARVLFTTSPRGFRSLISEWDRAGFLWEVVKGLSACSSQSFRASVKTVRILIAARVTRVLSNFILYFPDLKARLRLVLLFRESSSPKVEAEILAVARSPACHRLVARKIFELFSDASSPSVGRQPQVP